MGNKKKSGFIKRQGDIHEDSALKQIGSDAVNLNGSKENGGVMTNYPIYDLISSKELTSVKSHISQTGELTPQNIQSYQSNFSEMLGWNRASSDGKTPLAQDAERLKNLPQGTPVPDELRGASDEQMLDYLQHKTVMRIPDDHVQDVRDAIKNDIIGDTSHPSNSKNYFLPDNPTEEQIQTVLGRVQGTGKTAGQTLEEMGINPGDDKRQQTALVGTGSAGAGAEQAPFTKDTASEADTSEEKYAARSTHKEPTSGILSEEDVVANKETTSQSEAAQIQSATGESPVANLDGEDYDYYLGYGM